MLGKRFYRSEIRPLALVLLASLMDAATTSLGLALGLEERGPVASTALPLLGPLYWPLQAALLSLVYALLRRLGVDGWLAAGAAASGPWLAAWTNAAGLLSFIAGGP